MIILVTGASSGIGYQVAERLAKAGQTVYGKARHLVGRYVKLMVFLHAVLPTRLFDYFSRKF